MIIPFYNIWLHLQIGRRLRKLTKHARPKIQKSASDLLEFWKKLVAAESKNGVVESCSSEVSVNKSPVPTIKSLKPCSSEVSVNKSPVPTMKSQKHTEKIVQIRSEVKIKEETVFSNSGNLTKVKVESHLDQSMKDSSTTVKSSNSITKDWKPLNLALIPKTKDSTRDKLRESLAEALGKVLTEAEGHNLVRAKASDPIGVAVTVETAMFQSLGGFHGVNKTKYRSIMFNIKDSNNPDFRRKILLGDLSPEDIINLTPDQMASDQRKMENEEIKKKALFECERGNQRQASTDQFKCGKCGQRKCTYYQLQTRSADEPMTTYVTCVNCNNRWKFC
ncbi:hypothetical protein KP509_11G048300 [Ceratopteris richardii]|uniref:Transcription elongation factor n=1 Tax=Ceratopteris richardii TaxID=49495 RepID=A0A8T2TSM9_CERRI|nr:hypothetical protein KP509_11G048300 [Ceratopteris richardii]